MKILGLFLFWRLSLIVFLVLALNILPLGYKDRFLGGGLVNYQKIPSIFSWANFDGEHYLSIAIFGYSGLEQAFFPVYPMLISFLARPFWSDLYHSLLSSSVVGILISNIAFLGALIILWKLVKLDFDDKTAYWTLIILLLFPTSFYFGAVYNESLFLLLSVSSFYAARRNNWLLAGVLGAIASATRIFGLFLFPALLIEVWQRKKFTPQILWALLVPVGFLFYVVYQWLTVGDPLAFYRLQKLVGEQHQSGLTLLPQVYYRYLKILLTTNMSNPIYQTVFLELVVGIVFFILPIIGYFKKVRPAYIFYALIGFLTPTIQGSFSSVPRYVIVFFPSFIVMALIINKWPKWARFSFIVISFVWLAVETMLYLRGYWVA